MNRFDYDLVVIGGGAAGLTAAGIGASLGASTCMIERDRPGGDCTWHGCVPSKALLHIAGLVTLPETAAGTGVSYSRPDVDGRRVMQRVREIREQIYQESDSPEVLHSHGIDLVRGSARFRDQHSVSIKLNPSETRSISGRYFVIATGSRPTVPEVKEVPGLQSVRMVTTETVFDLEVLPSSLVILGAGPVGLELGQAFRRLGVEVSVVEKKGRGSGVLEPDHQERLVSRLENEGITFYFDARLRSVDNGTDFEIEQEGEIRMLDAEKLLVAMGRTPAIGDLDLERAGVSWSDAGIQINHSCQTTASHIYACGDVAEGLNLTHVAEEMARTAVRRIMLKVPSAYERRTVPFVLYTDPEAGSVGEKSWELERRGAGFRTIRYPYQRIDRARIVDSTDGEIMVHYAPVSGRILGAHVFGQRAGEILQEFVLAMTHGLTLRDLSSTVHSYPGWLQGARRAADQFYIQSGSAAPLKLLGSIFGYRGEVSDRIGRDDVV